MYVHLPCVCACVFEMYLCVCVCRPLQELAIGGGGGQGGGAEACPTADHSASYQVFADENQESSYAVFHDSQSAKM